MSIYVPRSAVILTTLAADVTNSSTFTVPYPTGFVQNDFALGGYNSANTYMVVGGNNRYTVAASQMSVTFGASLITVTNSTGQTLVAGSQVYLNVGTVGVGPAVSFQIPIQLVNVTANGVITKLSPGVAGTIEYAEFVVTVPATTASKLATLTPNVSGTITTGGAVALTSANSTPLGANIAGSAITAANVLKQSDTLGITASGVTAFAEGAGYMNIRVRLANPNAY